MRVCGIIIIEYKNIVLDGFRNNKGGEYEEV